MGPLVNTSDIKKEGLKVKKGTVGKQTTEVRKRVTDTSETQQLLCQQGQASQQDCSQKQNSCSSEH